MKKHLENTRFLVGPMSLNVVDALNEYVSDNPDFLTCFIPSRRQIDSFVLGGGYVNDWTTESFTKYVRDNSSIPIERDHGGPQQGKDTDNGLVSLRADIMSGIKLIHVDPWKGHRDITSAVRATCSLIEFCSLISEECFFEIGTEEAIRPYTVIELREFLKGVKDKLSPQLFSKILFCVVQSGTNVKGLNNIGDFDKKRSYQMSLICKDLGMLAKEHNCDYLNPEKIMERIDAGVDALNIAPEFGVIETRTIIASMDKYALMDEKQSFIDMCIQSGKWKKWVVGINDNISDDINDEYLAKICGHYIFSHPDFIKLKMKLFEKCDIDSLIKEKIKERIKELHELMDKK